MNRTEEAGHDVLDSTVVPETAWGATVQPSMGATDYALAETLSRAISPRRTDMRAS
jgi:hypothetical protein